MQFERSIHTIPEYVRSGDNGTEHIEWSIEETGKAASLGGIAFDNSGREGQDSHVAKISKSQYHSELAWFHEGMVQ